MKRIISVLMILAMLASVLCFSTSAATTYLNVNFKTPEEFTTHFIPGAFYQEEGVLFGYSEARALQSNYEASEDTYKWYTFDQSITLAIADDELNDEDRFVSLVYCNDNLNAYGRAEGVVYMGFYYDVDERQFEFGNGLEYTTDNLEMLMEPVKMEIDTESGEEFITLGMSIEEGRIRCFYNDQLIFDLNDTAGDWLIAKECNSPFVFWQNGNFNQITNITVAEHGALYPATNAAEGESTTAATQGGAVVTTTAKPVETTTRIEQVEVTDDQGNTVTDESGNKVTETVVITDAPVADTNTGAVQGGSSSSTGDVTFVVIAALVATIGCALIVRKVNVQ